MVNFGSPALSSSAHRTQSKIVAAFDVLSRAETREGP